MHRSALLITAGLLMNVLTSFARAETTTCTAITSVPYTITLPGIYCLTQDISTAMTFGVAIDIQANGVVLDLNGHKLGGLGAGPATLATGIAALKRQNVTIRNGTIRGFKSAIDLYDHFPWDASQGHLIERVRVDQNTLRGILVVGRGIIVRDNQVVATGGSTAYGAHVNGSGIETVGYGNRIINNDIVSVIKKGTGTAWGIGASHVDSADILIVGNRISGTDIGIDYNDAHGKYRDNLTSGVSVRFIGGTNAGNNN
jgi:hypothetical protein